MRFKRYPKHVFEDTPRKRAALRRKQQREREALPLFAAQIASEQPDEDSVMAERAQRWDRTEDNWRKERAEKWRRGRAIIASYSHNEARALRHAWQCAPYPADPVYLLGFPHSYAGGRFTLHSLPFALSPTNCHGHRLALTPEEGANPKVGIAAAAAGQPRPGAGAGASGQGPKDANNKLKETAHVHR